MFSISGHMETFDSVHSFREDDVQLDSLLDDVSTRVRLALNCSQPAVMQPADMISPAANCF